MHSNVSAEVLNAADRILLIDEKPDLAKEGAAAELCADAKSLGFTGMLWTFDAAAHVGKAVAQGTSFLFDLSADALLLGRETSRCGIQLYMDVEVTDSASVDDWAQALGSTLEAGVSGFRFTELSRLPPSDWQRLIERLKFVAPRSRFFAWTPGLSPDQLATLRDVGFDRTFLSLPWWDQQATWLIDEHARLGSVAPPIAPVMSMPDTTGPRTANEVGWPRALWTAAVCGAGVLVSRRLLSAHAAQEVQAVNAWLQTRRVHTELLMSLTGPLLGSTVLFHGGAGIVINPSSRQAVPINWDLIRSRLPDGYSDLDTSTGDWPDSLEPGGYQCFNAQRFAPIRPSSSSTAEKRKLGLGLISGPRIAIENVGPAVDEGRFAVKTGLGRSLRVEADVFMDGHDKLAACVAWKPADESHWREVPMVPLGNDRWAADLSPTRLGRHLFMIRAWHDVWESFRGGLRKKHEAGADIALDLIEGQLMLREAAQRARRAHPDIAELLATTAHDAAPTAEVMLSDVIAQAMATVDARPFEVKTACEFPFIVERREAEFASWYELFPRSLGASPKHHGTFKDVVKRLPAIRDMGFNVLYFPPIHPIGRTNRKGRNNSLSAAPGDPGSPYAIGSEAGGHDALHPELGGLDDFLNLVSEAKVYGLEIALDFAIQCSPDHPWLKEHRNWFNWRPDGSLRYAENPPKRYEDIVNPDFYHGSDPKARASLWRALRDIVLYWAGQGVRIFRVDNPHTKPLPFWEWMIGEVHAQYPDVVFLSEAFTRPRMMYRLAKLGFSQSYTYFTWRNTKHELTTYLEELNTRPVADFFRPNFFVNTPDINPYFLQTSGRAGFLIRAALATTMSGSWGMYSGFELCEAEPLPGKEEYKDSEKYELRARDWDQEGNIVAEIAQLNRIRKNNPALWTHLGIRFHTVHDDNVLFYSKSTPQADSIVLVGVTLDPRTVRRARIEIPLWLWGLADNATVQVEDCCKEVEFELQGKHHEIELRPDRPYFIWRVRRLA